MNNKILTIILFSFLLSCNSKKENAPVIITDKVIAEVIEILKKNSIESHKIKWDSLKNQLNQVYPEISNDSIRGEAINWMLKEYNFKHHFFMPKEMVQKWKGKNESNEQESTEYNFTYPSGKIISDDIGYVSIPTFSSGDSLQITIFAEKTQQTLKELIQLGAENWIVDLTECQGGNMWPMLSGIGPLIGKGKVGSFFTINDKEEGTWNYENGHAFILSKDSIVHTVKSPFVNKDINPNKIAVLQGEKTASSGEAILVAFLGKKNVRTFGRKTATYSTANESFDLTNGSILWVTTAVYADRDLNKYPDGILPMVEVENDSISLNEAIKWLNEK